MRGARLACVKHAASVRSEPGSNSQVHHPAPHPSAGHQTISPGSSLSLSITPRATQAQHHTTRTISPSSGAARASHPASHHQTTQARHTTQSRTTTPGPHHKDPAQHPPSEHQPDPSPRPLTETQPRTRNALPRSDTILKEQSPARTTKPKDKTPGPAAQDPQSPREPRSGRNSPRSLRGRQPSEPKPPSQPTQTQKPPNTQPAKPNPPGRGRCLDP